VGLISSNWGGTSIQVWMPSAANEACHQGNWSGDRYNAMIAPYTVGPMLLAGAIWYQGESNNGQGRYYECAFPAMLQAWRRPSSLPRPSPPPSPPRQEFRPRLWVGFVQIAGYRYGGASRPDPSGDLRQAPLPSRSTLTLTRVGPEAQLAALALPQVAVATTIDTGDWNSVHPPDKQTPSHRLATAALDQLYGLPQYRAAHAPPLYAGQALQSPQGGMARVLVRLTLPATTQVPRPAPSVSGSLTLALRCLRGRQRPAPWGSLAASPGTSALWP
jgi:sialate O-acetylesterase